jgi:hypothetical protein
MIQIDVDHQIKSVQRDLGARQIDTGTAHVVTVRQVYDTDPADLWDAVTNIERIPRWFLPISGDLKVGGSYQLEGQAGGTVLTCDPPKNSAAVGMGWDSMVLGLALHVSTGEAIDPSFGQQWLGTEDGRRFLTLSGEEWYATNLAFGVEPAVARAMADRCLKAYLGEK